MRGLKAYVRGGKGRTRRNTVGVVVEAEIVAVAERGGRGGEI